MVIKTKYDTDQEVITQDGETGTVFYALLNEKGKIEYYIILKSNIGIWVKEESLKVG